jgi:hypothetical protein
MDQTLHFWIAEVSICQLLPWFLAKIHVILSENLMVYSWPASRTHWQRTERVQ